MLNRFRRHALNVFIFSILPSSFLLAQSGSGGMFNTGLLVIAAIIFIVAVYLVTENLLGVESRDMGLKDPSSSKGVKSILGPKVPSYVDGPFRSFRRGHNILLKGVPTKEISDVEVRTFALQPGNFIGISPIPKVVVEVGSEVKAGDELFFDKKRPEVKYVAPVSGEIAAINRGAKRAISEVVIIADKDQKYKELPAINLDTINREDLVQFLLESGAWPLIRQRPHDIVADTAAQPANIFISTFDTAPLAPDSELIIKGNEADFALGVKMLSRLTEGKVYLGLNANGDTPPSEGFTNVPHAEKSWFAGPHPAGNVGIQIHHTAPITPQSVVWTLGVQDVITLGKLVSQRRFDVTRIVALTGESFENPRYVRTKQGAKISELIGNETLTDDDRIISGDVLSGHQKSIDQYLDFYDDQITAIEEGRHFDMFGWLIPGSMKPSVSRTFPGFLFKDLRYSVTTNTNGEPRAFVVTGQYEKLLPMDIYPQHLMKAIITNDFEKMEGLGIHELSEEDVALCEFACTSKQPLQKILREGLDFVREQG